MLLKTLTDKYQREMEHAMPEISSRDRLRNEEIRKTTNMEDAIENCARVVMHDDTKPN